MIRNLILLGGFFILFGHSGLAQKSAIKGKVISNSTGEILIGATVQIAGTTNGTITDFDGNFALENLGAGTYSIVASYISFKSDTIGSVKLGEGETKLINFNLVDNMVNLQSVVIQAKAARNTDNYITAMKQKSAIVMEGISSQEIGKRGDGNAAAAVKRVTGVTIEGGKYVYVRGLSDRYSKTTLNNSEIPGLDPNRNTVQMDLFPTSLIENMTISKTFAPNLPGDFSGGLVNIETKDFPEEQKISLSAKVGYNTLSSLNSNFRTYEGGSLDWLGMDDGTRSKPSATTGEVPGLFEDNDRLETISKSFNKNMDVSTKRSSVNSSYNFSYGNQKSVFGNKLGYIIGLTYSKSFSHREEDARTNRYDLSGNYQDVASLNVNRQLSDAISTEKVIWGALINTSYKIGNNNKISLRYMRNQNGNKTASFQQGTIPVDAPGIIYQTRALLYQERSMNFTQLQGEHYLEGFHKLKVDWFTSLTQSKQDEPDLRYFNNDYEPYINATTEEQDTLYQLQAALYSVPTRFYRSLSERSIDAKVFFELPLNQESTKPSKLKWGLSNINKQREVMQNRYSYQIQGINYGGDISAFISDDNMGLDSTKFIYISDASEKRNTYTSTQNVAAAFLMGDVWVGEKIRLITGARIEKALIEVQSLDTTLEVGRLDNTDILPSFNGTYALTPNQNLRFAYNRTLARPSFREIAPFADYDFATGWVRVGNPNLKRSLVDNIDMRWEIYPKAGEIISVGVFYKNFLNPIEVVFNPIASNAEITWSNVGSLDQQQNPNSIIYGAEFEFKKSLANDTSFWSKVKVGGNVSYIQSKTEIDSLSLLAIRAGNPDASNYRSMFGQSPYIVNSFIEFSDWKTDFSAIVSYNVSGPKLAVVMLGGLPDVYAQPVHQLDFKLIKGFNDKWQFSLSAQNLLDPIVKMTHDFKGEEYIFNSYRRGRTFSVGVRYSF